MATIPFFSFGTTGTNSGYNINVKTLKFNTLNTGFVYLGATGLAGIKQIATSEIADSTVTTVKIADSAITTAKIINNVKLSGMPTVDTPVSGTNTKQIANTEFVQTAISNLVDSAPETLNTLNELGAALGNDPNFATTITNSIAGKISKTGNEVISGVKIMTSLPECSSIPTTSNQLTNKTYVDAQVSIAQGITGPQGEQGTQGVQGKIGATGYTGAQGAQGKGFRVFMSGLTINSTIRNLFYDNNSGLHIGDFFLMTGGRMYCYIPGTLVDSETGDLVDFKYSGDVTDDSILIGPQGSTGNQGTNGAQGATGAPGTTGTPGTQGINGTQGATGAPGTQGINGTQGATGATGAVGAQGAQGKGFKVFMSGPTIDSTIRNLFYDNNSGLHIGDFFLMTGGRMYCYIPGTAVNATTGDLVDFKYSGDVTDDSILIGPQGSTGNKGTNGAQGATGIQGIAGAQGSTGSGIQGAQGVAGPQGIAGAQGSTGVGAQGSQGIQGAQGVPGTPIYNYNTINMDTNNTSLKKTSITYVNPTSITSNNIVTNIDSNNISNPQVYTFGSTVQNRLISLGSGTNTLAWSNDGLTWTGLGTTIFSTQGNSTVWNGTMWIATGSGTNTLAWSSDGIIWTSVTGSTGIFSTSGNGIAWNSSLFVATGSGTNTLAYSLDGLIWTPVTASTSIFSTQGNSLSWNGTMFVATGSGTNTLAWSSDGIIWTAVTGSTGIFSVSGNGVSWNGSIWVATGSGTNTLAYSYDGITWIGLGTSIFSTSGNKISWNGTMFIATGSGTNTLAYSYDGITWTGLGTSIFSTSGNSIVWNNSIWIAVGQGTNSIAWSKNGTTWIPVTGNTGVFSTAGNGIAFNYRRPHTATFSKLDTSTSKIGLCCGRKNRTDMSIYVGTGTFSIAYLISSAVGVAGSNSIFTTGNAVTGNLTRYVAVGTGAFSIASSTNGTTWSGISGSNSIFTTGTGVSCTEQFWVATGTGTNSIAWSDDGLTWTGVTGSTSILSTAYGVCFNGIVWIATGTGTYSLAYSYDGKTWTGLNGSTTIFSTAYSITTFNAKFFATGTGTNSIAWSYDGLSWIPVANSTSFLTTGYSISALNRAITRHESTSTIMVTGVGSFLTAYSTDGITWTGVSAGTSLITTGRVILQDATQGLGWWYVGGSGTNVYSQNGAGTSWPASTTFNSIFTQMNGIWKIKSATQGYMLSSTNEISTWTPVSDISNIFTNVTCLKWNGKMWLAGGAGFYYSLAYSYNGLNWFPVINSGKFMYGCLSLGWNGKMWIACPWVWGIGVCSGAYSYDGINWFTITTQYALAYAVWNGKLWSGAGTGAYMSYSYDGITWTYTGARSGYTAAFLVTNGNVFVSGHYSDVSYSTDGLTWYAVATTTNIARAMDCVWNKDKFILTGYNVGGTSNCGAYSYDGKYWYPTNNINSVITNGFAIGSSDVATIVVGSGNGMSNLNFMGYSYNGITWTAISSNNSLTSTTTINRIEFNTNSAALLNNACTINIQPQIVAVGAYDKCSIAYSMDGLNWLCSGSANNFFTQANDVVWNGTRWVAVGSGGNRIVYSSDGNTWIASATGNTLLSTSANGIVWTGLIFVAVGSGTNTIIYSANGITWTAATSSNTIFTTQGNNVASNCIVYSTGKKFVATGSGTNSLAYSANGIAWTAVAGSTSIFTIGQGVMWDGKYFIATGSGTHTLAISSDGVYWTGIIGSASIFTVSGYNIAWNGSVYVAVGQGTNSIAWSTDLIKWTGLGTSIFSTAGYAVTWNGKKFIAVGQGTNTIAYSNDGLTWIGVPNSSSIFTTTGYGIATNSPLNPYPCNNQIIVDNSINVNSVNNNQGVFGINKLDIVSEPYYNNGYTNMTMSIGSINLS